MEALTIKVEQWREQLFSISRFMWVLNESNESVARMANKEDQCTGRFWEGRFKSQALLDEKALAACMAYVDLNPVRAKMALTPENSHHTSIKKRIKSLKDNNTQPVNLAQFSGNSREPLPQAIPFQISDYIELVDITARAIRQNKCGYIDNKFPPILERLDISSREWLILTTQFESIFKSLVGCKNKLMLAAKALGLKRRSAYRNCQAILY